MTDIKKRITNNRIKCFNVINNKNDKRFGLQCGQLLMKRNSLGDAAGEIKCRVCKAKYEILSNELILIERG